MPKRKAAANVFMEQNIVRQQQQVEELEALEAELAVSDADEQEYSYAPAERRKPREQPSAPSPPPQPAFKTSEELQLEKEPIHVRETGFWLWKRIIVPPNAYVVHTRLGRKEPVTLGMGVSFRYNPDTDAYLVVPAAMQTIGIVANCISKEKQGINVLAYVQWQIDDFSIAYRRLDLSDSRDPLGIVNAQLREQAEAAIKDKIATMSVEEVLTDKEPVIEELTTRLKAVAEGRTLGDQGTGEGLGIKIVTVQIKEAYVSSQRLWGNLQAPFRYEKDKAARISYLTTQDEVRQKELETHQVSETRQAGTMVAIEEKAERITQFLDADAEPTQADLAFVFGTRHSEPAYVAADLFRRGVVRCVVLTGGENCLTRANEAMTHLEILTREGIPRDRIIVESQATNTLENVVLALPKIAARVELERIQTIVVVTKWYHCRRAMMTLKRYLPPHIRYFASTYEPSGFTRAGWYLDLEAARRILKEWRNIPQYLKQGHIAEIRRDGDAFT